MRNREGALLLESARDGDLEAFAEFVRLFERGVRSVLARLLDDPRDVEEAAQDTFVQAWRNVGRFRGDAAPFTWLYRIAVNEALQRSRRPRLDTQPLEEAAATPSGEGGPVSDGSRAAPEAAAERSELRALVAERLRALPIELRAPVVLRDLLGWSNQEVAEALDLSLPAAKSRIHRGRMQIRAELERRLVERG